MPRFRPSGRHFWTKGSSDAASKRQLTRSGLVRDFGWPPRCTGWREKSALALTETTRFKTPVAKGKKVPRNDINRSHKFVARQAATSRFRSRRRGRPRSSRLYEGDIVGAALPQDSPACTLS